jgi:protein-tyrosine kinase
VGLDAPTIPVFQHSIIPCVSALLEVEVKTMSKVFEALRKAERDQAVADAPLAAEPREIAPPIGPSPGVELPGLENLVSVAKSMGETKPSLGRLSPWLVAHWESDSPVVEQIKRVRTHIQHYTKSPKPPRVILVTSAIAGEGKSLTAANLAVSIAQGLSDWVLLVDADIRNPTLHNYFGQPQGPGLSEYLSGELELDSVLRATPLPRLTFIAGGGRKKNPVELVSSERMARLIEEHRGADGGRFIVVDSTPVLVTNEPSILAKIVDGVILVVRHDRTPRPALKETLSAITKDKILGLVFNDTQTGSLHIGYGYQKYYGSYDGGKKGKK